MFKLKRLDDGYFILEHRDGHSRGHSGSKFLLLSQGELLPLKQILEEVS